MKAALKVIIKVTVNNNSKLTKEGNDPMEMPNI